MTQTRPAMAQFDIRPPITDLVYDRLYAAIIGRELLPGSQLTEQALADQLNVSKTPVREALLRLRQVGLIEPDGRRGMRVVKLSLEDLRQATELRAVLEGFTAGRAAELATKAQARLITRAAEDSLDAAEDGNIDSFHQHDRAFHARIADAGNNVRARQCADNTAALIHTVMTRDTFPTPDHLVDCAGAHVRIGQAIMGGDAATASTEMHKHIWRIHELLLAQDLDLEQSDAIPFRPALVA
ncbi:MAG: hypothetical protein JWN21_564 [Sphingomonas bacterium]|uniref:GntR family transcriptional regulator n=1 Tax=Sphingomonas bacterium TaxID=1895847 RepID=UPI002634450B|nr:GntR family transcriptional regulator [Sphingomonas bacterium]MDB5695021.1 hypothetical protein [Sphingomonas bacterium]